MLQQKGKEMTTVKLTLKDLFTDKLITRSIDISNILVNDSSAPLNWECNILGNKEQQEARLNEWITDRGNEQHNTLLELVTWELN